MSVRLFKDFAVGDAHTTTALGNEGKRKFKSFLSAITMKPKTEQATTLPLERGGSSRADKSDWNASAPIVKVDDEQRMVWGWASVITEKGDAVTDSQGDQIDIADLVAAAHGFITDSRVGGDMHDIMGVGAVVESIVFAPEVQKALGVDLGKVGWFIGLKIEDDGVWKRVKSGELAAFSFGGRGVREPINS